PHNGRAAVGLPWRSIRRLRFGDQVDAPAAEEAAWIDVVSTPTRSEVQLVARPTDGLAGEDQLAALHADLVQKRIARANAVGVPDDDVQGAADLAGEHDDAVGCGHDHLAAARVVVDAPVAGAPRRRRRPEAVNDRRLDGRSVRDSDSGRLRRRARAEAAAGD